MMPLLIVLLLISQVASQELSSTLHSTIYGAQIAYTDETVVFTCIVTGSNSMAWTSEEYIGTGQRLPLSSAQGVGFRVTALAGNNQTVAILVNISTDTESDVIIVSELHFKVKSTYPIGSVQCVDSSTNAVTSTSFFLPDLAQVTCDRQSVCAGDSVTCTCITGNSTRLAWSSNGNRLMSFMSSDPLLTRQNTSGINGFAVLTETSNMNGIQVIMSNITVNVSSNDPEIILTCENIDRTTTEPIIIPTTENCHVNPTEPTDQISTTTDPGNETAPSKNSCAGPIAAAVIFGVIVIFLTVVLPIIIVVTYKMINDFKAQLAEKDQQISSLLEEKQGLIKEKDIETDQLKMEIDQMKEEIDQLKEEIDLRQQKLLDMGNQMGTEKAKISEELKKSMKKEIQEVLIRALKNKVNEDIEQALSGGTTVDPERTLKAMRKTLASLKVSMGTEIDAASSNLEQEMQKEFERILEDKKGSSHKQQHKDVSQATVSPSGSTVTQYIPNIIAHPISTMQRLLGQKEQV